MPPGSNVAMQPPSEALMLKCPSMLGQECSSGCADRLTATVRPIPEARLRREKFRRIGELRHDEKHKYQRERGGDTEGGQHPGHNVPGRNKGSSSFAPEANLRTCLKSLSGAL